MRIYNAQHKCDEIQRHITYVQLYKILKTHTEQKEINNIVETVITGRDYEFVSLVVTDDMNIVDGIDPLKENFDLYFQKGLDREINEVRNSKIQKAREERWRLTNFKIFNNNIFSNLASERNANLLYMSIGRYKNGKYVNWMNLDGNYIKITDENINSLESLYNEISDFTQITFDVLNKVILKIRSISVSNELFEFDVEKEWSIAFNEVSNALGRGDLN